MRQLVTLEYTTDIDVLEWAYWGAIGTFIGAWLGAVPIPLDWDREWQALSSLETLIHRNGLSRSSLEHTLVMRLVWEAASHGGDLSKRVQSLEQI